MKGIILSKEESLEAEELYEKINGLLSGKNLNAAIFGCALTNCLSDLIAQLCVMYGKDQESLLKDVMEDIERPIGNKIKYFEKMIRNNQSTSET